MIIHGNTTERFTIPDIDTEHVACGRGTYSIKVVGFWSDPITLRLERQGFKPDADWHMDVSHSSGGCDPKQVTGEFEGEKNLAYALFATIAQGELIRAYFIPAIEADYQAKLMRDAAEREARKLADQAAIDADPPLGIERATTLVGNLYERLRLASFGSELLINTKHRGSTGVFTFGGAKKKTGVTFYWSSGSISRDKLIDKLAVMSHLSTIAEKEA
jgi:hypothetical protein